MGRASPSGAREVEEQQASDAAKPMSLGAPLPLLYIGKGLQPLYFQSRNSLFQ